MRSRVQLMAITLNLGLFVLAVGCAHTGSGGHRGFHKVHHLGADCDPSEPADTCGWDVSYLYNHAHDSEVSLQPSRHHKLKITDKDGTKQFTVTFQFRSADTNAQCKDQQGNVLMPFSGTFPTQPLKKFGPIEPDPNRVGCHYKTIVDDGSGPSDPHIYIDPTP